MEEQRPGLIAKPATGGATIAAGGVPVTLEAIAARVDEMLERISALECRQAIIVRQQFGDADVNLALDVSSQRDEMLAWARQTFPIAGVDNGGNGPAG